MGQKKRQHGLKRKNKGEERVVCKKHGDPIYEDDPLESLPKWRVWCLSNVDRSAKSGFFRHIPNMGKYMV